jgi:uncharacterized membrane protein YkvA (DUF1232 family)
MNWAQSLQRDVMTLWFALKHRETPWMARALAAVLVAYALSPVDLIPDFIPVLGLLDDLLIVPAGVWLLLKLLPAPVMVDCRTQAQQWWQTHQKRPKSWAGLALILTLWGFAAWLTWRFVSG